ncbi:hypothetical protein BOX15_Mlig008835g1 [Macrostomum lignano]|uniref:RING-CH-type domain-containing protein n=1 Tax=Macrostomum lignano TaxID=282301 RepID=A0A267FIM0_9PLAT|nr:hypothetical protein BOX15_Mlig008835g1 [Macrostomum lignano]
MQAKAVLRNALSCKTLPGSTSSDDTQPLPVARDGSISVSDATLQHQNCHWRRHSYHEADQPASLTDQQQHHHQAANFATTEERATSTVLPTSQQAATSTSDLDATAAAMSAANYGRSIDDCGVVLTPLTLCAGAVPMPSASPAATDSAADSNELICRICHSSETEAMAPASDNNSDCQTAAANPLISPCLCSGTLKYVHRDCLQYWVKSQDIKMCELCHFGFIMSVSTKPISEWRKLDMTPMERRKVICSVAFHVIALTCVVWSLYVLIEKTAMEVGSGKLEWSFWTKLVVVAIGFTGGLLFMYVQCRTYFGLCRRWRSFNRTFLIQSATEADLNAARDRVKAEQQQLAVIV